jgi:hypothetical protein
MSSSLEHRIWKLEQLEKLKNLKARYWHACDLKDVEAVRDCYAPGRIDVDFDGTGQHENRDAFFELFEKFSLRDYIVEHHHGGPAQLEIVDETTATGVWSLQYRLMNTKEKTLFVVGGYYSDEYDLVEGEWLIRKSSFRAVSTIGYGWAKGGWKLLHADKSLKSGPDEVE